MAKALKGNLENSEENFFDAAYIMATTLDSPNK